MRPVYGPHVYLVVGCWESSIWTVLHEWTDGMFSAVFPSMCKRNPLIHCAPVRTVDPQITLWFIAPPPHISPVRLGDYLCMIMALPLNCMIESLPQLFGCSSQRCHPMLPSFPGRLCVQMPSEELGPGDLVTYIFAHLVRVASKGTWACCGSCL